MIVKVKQIIKSHTNTTRTPVVWCELECGHTATCEVIDWRRSAHELENQRTKLGDEIACERCDWYADKLVRLRAMTPADLSHSRFRHHDSRGFGPGSLYIYGRDPKSPTGVHLLFSIDDGPEAQAELSRLRAAPLSPTEKR